MLRLPVIAAPMFLISGVELVVAACQAGVIGAFPTHNCRTPAELDAWMAEIAARTKGAAPWAANLVTHSTNIHLAEELEIIARHKPPYVITALGSPKPVIPVVHAYGGKVIADVVNLRLAHKAVEAGADGLACVAAGAGGHTGTLSPFAFVSAVRRFFDGLVILGGGIGDGAGVAAAIAAGADLVYMGTRFIAAEESLADPAYKRMVADCGLDDLVVSAAITGTPASWLKPSLAAAGMDPAAPAVPRDYAGGDAAHKRWKDLWSAGQSLVAVTDVEPTAAIVDRLARDYEAARARLANA